VQVYDYGVRMMFNGTIPKRFKLLGCTVTVDIDNEYFNKGARDGYYGFSIYRESRIILREHDNKEMMMQTFFHELTHFVMYNSGYNFHKKEEYMHQEEGFVDLTASLFHQALTTMEYDDDQPT
jgi:hypothetical protein